MKILYGVQATGNGHITRARAMSKHLTNAGLDVDYIFSGRPRDEFFDMDEFGEWDCKQGLTFAYEAGNVKILKTLRQNNLGQLWRDINTLDLKPYDLIITDFEPITAWAAHKQKKTCLGLGHQYAFGHTIPRRGASFMSTTIMKYFAPASMSLGLHWHHFGQAILPPIAETHDSDLPVDQKKYVVYLGFEEKEDVLQLLEPFEDYLFVYYGPFPHYESYNNIQMKPLSRDGFKADLASAAGVICNAGFELSSEAIQLGKKLLVKPLHGQVEQLSNAKALEELDLAMTMDKLNKNVLADWLQNFEGKQVIYPDVAKAIARWIAAGEWENSSALVQDLWSAVEAEGVPSFADCKKLDMPKQKAA